MPSLVRWSSAVIAATMALLLLAPPASADVVIAADHVVFVQDDAYISWASPAIVDWVSISNDSLTVCDEGYAIRIAIVSDTIQHVSMTAWNPSIDQGVSMELSAVWSNTTVLEISGLPDDDVYRVIINGEVVDEIGGEDPEITLSRPVGDYSESIRIVHLTAEALDDNDDDAIDTDDDSVVVTPSEKGSNTLIFVVLGVGVTTLALALVFSGGRSGGKRFGGVRRR